MVVSSCIHKAGPGVPRSHHSKEQLVLMQRYCGGKPLQVAYAEGHSLHMHIEGIIQHPKMHMYVQCNQPELAKV